MSCWRSNMMMRMMMVMAMVIIMDYVDVDKHSLSYVVESE